jgi:hypothetical protein
MQLILVVTDFSGQIICPIFEVQRVQEEFSLKKILINHQEAADTQSFPPTINTINAVDIMWW